ncbi:MAG: hypothetical protein JSS83_29220 [Cyanobacteria bacterium SZAS LIN-3]|nr:hypothetical protein [Cyanobacteria bacterium SZAS LIN-3]
MICPHCSSPRHNLCAAGFRLEVDMTTLADACSDFSAAHLHESKAHLLGTPAPAAETEPANVPFSSSTLVVLPAFEDTGLGTYGSQLAAARIPAVLKDGKLEIGAFHGQYGQTHLVVMASDDNPAGERMNVLFIGLGKRAECAEKSVCGLVGTALESAVSGLYEHVVIAMSDFTGATVNGRQIGAVSRCRLAQSIIEDQSDRVLQRMTLIVQAEQVPALCQGIDITGPLCSSCDHPHAGMMILPRK